MHNKYKIHLFVKCGPLYMSSKMVPQLHDFGLQSLPRIVVKWGNGSKWVRSELNAHRGEWCGKV